MPNPTNPEFETLLERIAAGELTRAQAAAIAHEKTGRSPNTFLSWISGSPARQARLKAVRLTVGVNNIHAHKDPDKVKAYADALELALSKKTTIKDAADRFGVDYKYLVARVQRAGGARRAKKVDRTADDATVSVLEQALQ